MLTATALLLVAAWTGILFGDLADPRPVFDAGRGDEESFHALPQRPGMGPPLERHPFSGQVRSVGELLHTP